MPRETEPLAVQLVRALYDAGARCNGARSNKAPLPMPSSSLPRVDGYRLKVATSH